MWISTVWAQEAAGAQQQSTLTSLLPLALMFAVLYFFILRPQAKKAKLHQELLKNLKRGDEVITSGGIYGKVDGITEEFVTLEIASETKMKVLRQSITRQLREPQA